MVRLPSTRSLFNRSISASSLRIINWAQRSMTQLRRSSTSFLTWRKHHASISRSRVTIYAKHTSPSVPAHVLVLADVQPSLVICSAKTNDEYYRALNEHLNLQTGSIIRRESVVAIRTVPCFQSIRSVLQQARNCSWFLRHIFVRQLPLLPNRIDVFMTKIS